MSPDDEDIDDGEDLAALLGDAHVPALPDTLQAVAPSEAAQAAEVEWLAAFADLRKPRHAAFVAAYITGKDGTASAKAAGYSLTSAHAVAHKLLTERRGVMRALAAWRERQRLQGEYGVEQAMAEAERAMILAEKANQMNAFVRAVELRARLNALLVDRAEVTVDAGPNVLQALTLAKNRAALVDVKRAPQIVDGQYTEVSEA